MIFSRIRNIASGAIFLVLGLACFHAVDLLRRIGTTSSRAYPVQKPLPLTIGSDRELFVDSFLIESIKGLDLLLHHPLEAPASEFPPDTLEYGTIIKDSSIFRLYTRDKRCSVADGDSCEVTLYCESSDGINWKKPDLGILRIAGNPSNNGILHEAPFCHNFSPFLDLNPLTNKNARFKALAGTMTSGLFAFHSADGIHWIKSSARPALQFSDGFYFDSQNAVFWSETEGQYVCYFRHWTKQQFRSISRAVSKDFIRWSKPVSLMPNFRDEHLYTSQTQPYFRARQIYFATPTRFFPEKGKICDILFMSARGGGRFDRTFPEAWIRPCPDSGCWRPRSNFAALNLFQTSATEMSIYVSPTRRYVMRLDGIASLHAGAVCGELITRPFRFSGSELEYNFETSAAGEIVTEVLDLAGNPVSGFSLQDAIPKRGNSISSPVRWKSRRKLSELNNSVIRLRIIMKEADLYSFRFFWPEKALE